MPVPQLFDKLEYKMRGNRMVKVEELMEMLQSCSTEEDLRYLMKLARRVKAKGQTLPARFLTKLIHQSCNLECPELGLEATREGFLDVVCTFFYRAFVWCFLCCPSCCLMLVPPNVTHFFFCFCWLFMLFLFIMCRLIVSCCL